MNSKSKHSVQYAGLDVANFNQEGIRHKQEYTEDKLDP